MGLKIEQPTKKEVELPLIESFTCYREEQKMRSQKRQLNCVIDYVLKI
jgi:hypothetical protein